MAVARWMTPVLLGVACAYNPANLGVPVGAEPPRVAGADAPAPAPDSAVDAPAVPPAPEPDAALPDTGNPMNAPPRCGNGAVEPGEQCDPPAACQGQSDACLNDADTIRARTGDVAACTFRCASSPRLCSATPDTFCPRICQPCAAACGDSQDIDCKFAGGAPCPHGNQCSIACADGVCCNTACTAPCQGCDLAGSRGSCIPTTGMPRPGHAACSRADCAGTCAARPDGQCTYPTCLACCKENVEGMRAFQQYMYGCACSDCYTVCAATLCDTNDTNPSPECIACVEAQNSEVCRNSRSSCQTNTPCGRFATCSFECN
jgi:hypothetical protein